MSRMATSTTTAIAANTPTTCASHRSSPATTGCCAAAGGRGRPPQPDRPRSCQRVDVDMVQCARRPDQAPRLTVVPRGCPSSRRSRRGASRSRQDVRCASCPSDQINSRLVLATRSRPGGVSKRISNGAGSGAAQTTHGKMPSPLLSSGTVGVPNVRSRTPRASETHAHRDPIRCNDIVQRHLCGASLGRADGAPGWHSPVARLRRWFHGLMRPDPCYCLASISAAADNRMRTCPTPG